LVKTSPFEEVNAAAETTDEETEFSAPAKIITVYDVYPFTYDGRNLTENGSMPDAGYDVNRFDDHTIVAAEVTLLAYNMDGKEPGFSAGMLGLYHLGTQSADAPSTPGKRKGGCIVSPRRQKGAPFAADPSKAT
jgi:hypothetical protein